MKPSAHNTIWMASLVLVALLGFFQTTLKAEASRKATVIQVQGTADVQKVGGAAWVPATKGMEIGGGDTLRTSLDSLLEIQLQDGSAFRLDQQTKMTLDTLAESKENARFLLFFNRPVDAKKAKLKLMEGRILASVTPLPNSQSSFRVETPKGVAGVRGTNWSIGIQDLITTVSVRAGFINFDPRAGSNVSSHDFLQALANVFNGGKSNDGMDSANAFRVNEGMGATINDNGNVTFTGLSEDQVRELSGFSLAAAQAAAAASGANQPAKPPGPEPTASAQQAEEYLDKEVLGNAGGSSGDVRSEIGSGQQPNNAGVVRAEGVTPNNLRQAASTTSGGGGPD